MEGLIVFKLEITFLDNTGKYGIIIIDNRITYIGSVNLKLVGCINVRMNVYAITLNSRYGQG